eukprot:11216751-Lingulodinium_polyedra.AAC.1
MLGAMTLGWRHAARRLVAQVRSAAGSARLQGPDDAVAHSDELQGMGSQIEVAGADPPLPPPPLGHTP